MPEELPGRVMWVGGMCGVGKTTAATRVARRHDLWLYPMDSRMLAHEQRLQVADLSRTVDELWLDRTPQQMADEFQLEGRQRFELMLEELGALPGDGAPILVEGSFLRPDLVGDASLFIVADPSLTDDLLRRRGSLTFQRARNPERAHANRVQRDALLGERLRAATSVVEIFSITETESVVVRFVRMWAADWIACSDHGDVAARRRDANDRWFDQWLRYADIEPQAREGTRWMACECGRRGCMEQVEVRSQVRQAGPLLAH